MCGIAGIINFSFPEDMQDLLRRMVGRLYHRGPEAVGIFLNGPAGLAHTRLSIIDLDGGNQPICNEDRDIWISFNGEIFNYPELREDLISRGHRFATRTDTEVLVHLYEDFGPEMLKELNGHFAFALWDRKKERLLLSRDRVGICPLFYHQNGGRLVFGSEVKAIFADSTIPCSLNPQALSDIFTCWAPLGSLTAFEDIYQVPPGHYMLFSREGITIDPYWQLSFNDTENPECSLSEYTEQLRCLLTDAARIRLRADVPVGAYLSGGLDSTYISTIVQRNFNNRLRTFSVSFTDGRFDETPFQEKAVSVLGTEHRSIRCTEKDIGEIFPEVIWHSETPILRTSPAPLYMLSKLVRDNHFKVVLTGEGSDEIFAGYNIYKEDRVRRFWARNQNSQLRPRLLERLYPYIFSQGDSRSRTFLKGFFKKGLADVNCPAYSHMLRWGNTAQLRSFFSAEVREKTGNLDRFIERFASTLPPDYMSWHPLSRAQYTEICIFLSNYLLSSQGDRMIMANSVEGRFPYLDHRVIEFACRIPHRYRLNGLNEKFILKQAARNFVPPEIIDRPKQPYRAPISRCFFGQQAPDYVEELLSENLIRRNGYFDPKNVSMLAEKCRRGNGALLSERENMALAGILSTQLLDHHFVRNSPSQPIREPKILKVFRQ